MINIYTYYKDIYDSFSIKIFEIWLYCKCRLPQILLSIVSLFSLLENLINPFRAPDFVLFTNESNHIF